MNTSDIPPDWAMKAQDEISAALGFNFIGDSTLAAIIARHAPTPDTPQPDAPATGKQTLAALLNRQTNN
jgi:hypothetical protein